MLSHLKDISTTCYGGTALRSYVQTSAQIEFCRNSICIKMTALGSYELARNYKVHYLAPFSSIIDLGIDF